MSHSTTVRTRHDRISTAVEVFGVGPPLVYLHGPFGFVEKDLVQHLAEHFTVYVPAHPGFEGTSGTDELGSTVFDLVLHYDDVLQELGLPQPMSLVGHSYGAFIAAEMAAFSPERVGRLALISPLGLWLDESPQPDLFGLTPRTLAANLFRDPAGPAATALFRPPEDRAAAAEWNRRRRASAVGVVKYLWPIPDKGLRTRTYRIKAPTALIWGEDDRVVPVEPYLPGFRALLSQTTATVCPDAGHMVVLEQPGAVAAAVLEHVRE
jgi:pimeloyl-ACP methyl ester carboxylesterase